VWLAPSAPAVHVFMRVNRARLAVARLTVADSALEPPSQEPSRLLIQRVKNRVGPCSARSGS